MRARPASHSNAAYFWQQGQWHVPLQQAHGSPQPVAAINETPPPIRSAVNSARLATTLLTFFIAILLF